jgi:hypothetical protein
VRARTSVGHDNAVEANAQLIFLLRDFTSTTGVTQNTARRGATGRKDHNGMAFLLKCFGTRIGVNQRVLAMG